MAKKVESHAMMATNVEPHAMANPTTKSDWVNSIKTLVQAVDYDYIQSCSISVVPEGLKKWNEDAYIPKKVSIGPRFKGSRQDLLLMEDVKLSCMLSLIHRAGKDGEAAKNLEQCSEAVWELDEEVRASYLGDIVLKQPELAKIMLLDGCFLLELLISKSEKLNSQLRSRLHPPGPAAEVLKDNDVLSDLMLLENQIPSLVLHELLETLFPNLFQPDRLKELRAKKINNLALSVLGYPYLDLPSFQSPHFLDVVHSFVNGKTAEDEYNVVVDILDTIHRQTRQLKLNRCALRLLTTGVTIKPVDDIDSTGFGLSCFSLVRAYLGGMLIRLATNFILNGEHFDTDHIPEDVELKGLNFYFNFVKGKLEIEQLHITKTTKAKWCNLIAWEHHEKYKYVSPWSIPSYNEEGNTGRAVSGGGKFTWAALIFNGLICSADDVQLLKDNEIIVDHLKMSNQELMEFFRKIAFGVDHKVVDSSNYIQMVDDINNYSCKAFIVKRMWKTVWTSFTYRQE